MTSSMRVFFTNLYRDYAEAFKEAFKSPRKASLYGGATLFVIHMFRTNEIDYRSEIISSCNRLWSVAPNSQNPKSSRFIQQIGEHNCHGLLRQVDLGFTTLIYRSDTNPETALYKYNCSYLRPSIKEFFQERLVDVSLLGHCLFLEYCMKDYDVNSENYETN